MSFSIRMNVGQERSAFTVVSGGTATGNIDVVVDDAELTTTMFPNGAGLKAEAIRLLREAANLIEAGDWPLA
jgi:hypothetical protein